MTANKSSTAVSREIQSSVYTQQKRKTNCKQLDYVATFFFQRFMVGVSTKRRVFQYLNNLSRPDQQDKMMAVNVPANNWDVHIRTCRRPRTMLTFLVELQRRSQWPQFKTAVQTFCLFAFMCWQLSENISCECPLESRRKFWYVRRRVDIIWRWNVADESKRSVEVLVLFPLLFLVAQMLERCQRGV